MESASSEKFDSSELYSSAEDPDSEIDNHSRRVPSAASVSDTLSCNLTPTAGGSLNIALSLFLSGKNVLINSYLFIKCKSLFDKVIILSLYSS